MQQIADIMTRDVRSVSSRESVQRAAQIMTEINVGVIPVCDGDQLVGMVTDRDITVRATSTGELPENVQVKDVMTSDVNWCFDDQSVDEVMEQMRGAQIRRVPVMDHNTKKLVGIVSLGDLATKHSAEVDRTLEDISRSSEAGKPPLNS